MRPEDVEFRGGMGGDPHMTWSILDPKTGQSTGRIMTSGPIDRAVLPPTLYHTTTHLREVKASTHLLGVHDGGGLGGGVDPGVSLTSSLDDARLIRKELRRAIEMSTTDPYHTDKVLARYQVEDERENGLAPGALNKARDFAVNNWLVNVTTSPTHQTALEALQAYLQMRESVGQELSGKIYGDFQHGTSPLKNPLILGRADDFAKLDPANVGIVTVPRDDLPKRALVREGTDDFLHEVRVHADVPLAHAQFVEKAYDPSEPRDERGRWADSGGDGGAAPKLPALARRVAEPIARYEDQYRGHEIEHAVAVGNDGVVYLVKDGAYDHVSFSQKDVAMMTLVAKDDGLVFTHNHPGARSFSEDDVRMAAKVGFTEMRAVGRTESPNPDEPGVMDVTYRMRPGSAGFPDPGTLHAMYDMEDKAVYGEFKTKLDDKDSDLTEPMANYTHQHEVWTRLARRFPQHFVYSREEVMHA